MSNEVEPVVTLDTTVTLTMSEEVRYRHTFTLGQLVELTGIPLERLPQTLAGFSWRSTSYGPADDEDNEALLDEMVDHVDSVEEREWGVQWTPWLLAAMEPLA